MASAPQSGLPVINAKYALLGELGAGGAATVFEAENLLVGKHVALKPLAPSLAKNPAVASAFIAEARIAARIAHPNVVDILDVGIDRGDRPYIVMELLVGETLEQILARRGPLPVPYACELALQVLAAVQAAHQVGIIHRDLKPANVMVTHPEPDRPHVTVLDFGIAQGLFQADAPELESLRWAGTPAYMAPEQALGGEVDGRADVFSACAMLYELLSGSAPYEGLSLEELLKASLGGRFDPLAERAPAVPLALARIIESGLCPEPAHRPQSAWQLAEAIAPFASGRRRTSTFQRGTRSCLPIPLVRHDAKNRCAELKLPAPAPLPSFEGERLERAPETSMPKAVRGVRRSNLLAGALATALGFGLGLVAMSFVTGLW